VSTEQPPAGAAAGGRPGSSGIGVAGFVTGLVGLLLSWIPIAGLVLGAVGIVLGGVGVARARTAGGPTGLPIAGVVLGALAVIAAIVLIALVVDAGTA
jgi:hypothetical protein